MTWSKDEIKNLRLRLGWTQSDLARRLQISVQQIDHWEQGAAPDSQILQELELLLQQATFCSEEVRALPAAESQCDSNSVVQIDFSRVKGELQ